MNVSWSRHLSALLRRKQLTVWLSHHVQILNNIHTATSCACQSMELRNLKLFTRKSLPSLFFNLPALVSGSTLEYVKRGYAKSKDKGKGDKGKKKKVEVNEEQLAEVFRVDKMKLEMQNILDIMKEQYVVQLSIRSSLGSLESLPVELDGNKYILQELGQVVRKSQNVIVINMSVFPQAIPAVMNTLINSGMNLNPQQDKTTIFVPVPKVTKEHREMLSKNAKVLFIKCRDSVKDVQNSYIKKVTNKTNISEDLVFNIKEQITAIGDQFVSTAEAIMEAKQAELSKKE